MASIIVMPQMGYDMREGRIVKWLKSEGDAVERGDEVAEIETDKAVVPMRATASGVLRRILAQEGSDGARRRGHRGCGSGRRGAPGGAAAGRRSGLGRDRWPGRG